MTDADYFTRTSAELEARYRRGDYKALVEIVRLCGSVRPLPAWAGPEAVEHLEARFGLGGTGKGKPGPQERTGEFEKRYARALQADLCIRQARLGRLDLAWLNRIRERRNLPELRPGDLPAQPTAFDFAHALLRQSPAAASAKTIENNYRQLRRDFPEVFGGRSEGEEGT